MIYRISVFIVLFTSFFSVSYANVVISSPTGGGLIFYTEKIVNIMKVIHGVKFFFPMKVSLLISAGMIGFTSKTALQKSHLPENI